MHWILKDSGKTKGVLSRIAAVLAAGLSPILAAATTANASPVPSTATAARIIDSTVGAAPFDAGICPIGGLSGWGFVYDFNVWDVPRDWPPAYRALPYGLPLPDGKYLCEFKPTVVYWDLRWHIFVVGIDRTIFHTWQKKFEGQFNESWVSLGGRATEAVSVNGEPQPREKYVNPNDALLQKLPSRSLGAVYFLVSDQSVNPNQGNQQ